ncbi:hypothetical protein ACSX1A_15535 [Pontibacter sp. MBLB2868]|uniref:hypothetical protein n=1 Tax=Pontibacter sp. MBLB2868 TaxID=3451555 RepID=UPI003F753DA7
MYSYLLEEFSKAIGARLVVKFECNGYYHVAEPHLLGRHHLKQDCILGWVISSSSPEFTEEGWHVFPLNKIENLTSLEERFCNTRPGYDPYDSTMTRIYYRF